MRLRPACCTAVDPHAWTGPTGAQIRRLTGQLRDACPDTVRGRRRAHGFPDRVLLLVPAHRTNPTRQQPAALFGISGSAVHRVVGRLAPHLADLLGLPPTDRRELWIADGTLIPVHDKHRTAKSKNDRRSVNTQIVCRARGRRIVAAGEARPGNRNDTTVFKETPGRTLPNHARLTGDGGYRGQPPHHLTAPRARRPHRPRPAPPPVPQTSRPRRTHHRPPQRPPDPPAVPTPRRGNRPRHRRRRHTPPPQTRNTLKPAEDEPGTLANALRDIS
jgi:hypothetical protein